MLGARPALGRLFVAEEDAPAAPATAVLEPRHVDAPLRRRSARRRPLDHAERPAATRSSACCRAAFSLPREVLPTLGVAEDGEILLPLPLAADAATDPRPRGLQHHRHAEAAASRVAAGAGGDGRDHRAAAPRLSRTSIRRTAA